MKTIASYPAYDVVDLEVDVLTISAEFKGLKFCVEYNGKYKQVSPNCIQYCAAEMGKTQEQVEEKIENAKKNGESIYWLNNCATSITNSKDATETLWLLKVGQIVKMAGQSLEVVHLHHEFFRLKEI